VFAVGVVVGFDVGEEFGAGVVGINEGAALEHFGFEGAHEGFGPGIVVGIGPGGHALPDAVGAQELPEGAAAVLAAAVAVEDGLGPAGKGTGSKGLPEGVADEAGFEVVGQGPTVSAITQSAPPENHFQGFKVHHFRR